MRVDVRLFSVLRRYAPEGAEVATLELEPGATVGRLLERLGVPEGVERVVLVNGHHGSPETPLADGDVVTLFPPVAGG
jgi:molybdopterin converting factor small subunit